MHCLSGEWHADCVSGCGVQQEKNADRKETSTNGDNKVTDDKIQCRARPDCTYILLHTGNQLISMSEHDLSRPSCLKTTDPARMRGGS
jgi:hypothetical protein